MLTQPLLHFYCATWFTFFHWWTHTHTPTVVLILALQADLPAMLRIVLGQEPSRLSKPLTGTTEQCITATVLIVQLKGVRESELRGSKEPIILLLICWTSMELLRLGFHLGIRLPVPGSLCSWGCWHLVSLSDEIVLLLWLSLSSLVFIYSTLYPTFIPAQLQYAFQFFRHFISCHFRYLFVPQDQHYLIFSSFSLLSLTHPFSRSTHIT